MLRDAVAEWAELDCFQTYDVTNNDLLTGNRWLWLYRKTTLTWDTQQFQSSGSLFCR